MGPVSRRLQGFGQSDIRRMTRECERVGGINLGQGLCALPTPAPIRDGAMAAVKDGASTYSHPEGVLALREAIARKVSRDNGLSCDPATDVVVTVGATGAFTAALVGLLDPGDGVLIPEPFYGYHVHAAKALGLSVQHLALRPPHFDWTEEALRGALEPDTRAIVVCTPSNPTGRMMTRPELEVLDRVAAERDLLVITDEIYEYIRYDGREHVSPATVGTLGDRTVSIMGLSKTFSVTGWRLGYAVAPEAMARAMTQVNDLLYVCAPTPLQVGAVAAMDVDPDFYQRLAAGYAAKRDRTCEALEAAGLSPLVPEGAYYVLADTTSLDAADAQDAAMIVLEEAGVASIPGTAFTDDPSGETLLRFCFAVEDDVLDEACRRLRKLRRSG